MLSRTYTAAVKKDYVVTSMFYVSASRIRQFSWS